MVSAPSPLGELKGWDIFLKFTTLCLCLWESGKVYVSVGVQRCTGEKTTLFSPSTMGFQVT